MECFEGEGPQALCALLAVENMPRSRQREIFGPPSCPAVHAILPRSFLGRMFIKFFLVFPPKPFPHYCPFPFKYPHYWSPQKRKIIGKYHVDIKYRTAHQACTVNVVSLDVLRSVGDLSSWTDLSLRASIINAVCVRRGLGGRIQRQGK